MADFFRTPLDASDPELSVALGGEQERQRDQTERIASENIVSRAVLEAQGSVLTDKYAEGYPGRRYYGGCEWGERRASGAEPDKSAIGGRPSLPEPCRKTTQSTRFGLDRTQAVPILHFDRAEAASSDRQPIRRSG